MLRSYNVQKKLNQESSYDVSLLLLASMLLIQMHLFTRVCVCVYIKLLGWGRRGGETEFGSLLLLLK